MSGVILYTILLILVYKATCFQGNPLWKAQRVTEHRQQTFLDAVPRTKQSPSRNNKPKPKQKSPSHLGKNEQWRIFGVEVHPDQIEPSQLEHDTAEPSPALIQAVCQRLKMPDATLVESLKIIRRSVDARTGKRRSDGSFGPRYVYVVDVHLSAKSPGRIRHQPGRCERLSQEDIISKPQQRGNLSQKYHQNEDTNQLAPEAEKRKRVIIVGAGPAGLFCALTLARQGFQPIVLERGQPVESRGKDIGALMHRRTLDQESNFAFGEGGAGTWSDGKLTTRIGRNSDAVRHVLETFVQYGAPPKILIDGAPHLGTDNLVRLLRNMRMDLRRLGGEIIFGCKVTGLVLENDTVCGVKYEKIEAYERLPRQDPVQTSAVSDQPMGTLLGDAVVLATGHSARDIYEHLATSTNVKLEPKGFAVGFRVEHPQKIINKIQLGTEWGPQVVTGKTTTDLANHDFFKARADVQHVGRIPVPSYRLATDEAYDGSRNRGAYSFCMCPGGQIVPASTDPEEVCVNGMSFSRRDSLWANSALVVTIDPDDPVLEKYRERHGILAGVAFQRDMERRASQFGGGNLTVPVQRLTDFLAERPSETAPPSSYRLGVKPSSCHLIYPEVVTKALHDALVKFDQRMPGFVCEEGLLHGVETRTSSPLRLSRDSRTYQADGINQLYPSGEGAGFSGGIVSAAVDGWRVAEAIIANVLGLELNPSDNSGAVGFSY